jgi:arylsulfatase A-like enzyme
VGKILAALDRAKLRDNTVVIFLSDNGGSTGTENNDPLYAGKHPSFKIPAHNGILRGRKGQLYEGGIRTPALISWPGKLRPRDEHSPIHVADWFPTIAGLAGFKPKDDLKWDGRDRWRVLAGEAKPESRVLYWLGPGRNSLALRRGDMVLIQQKDRPDELYDLAADPAQKINLAPRRPEIVRELTELLTKVRANDNDAKVN